MAATTQLSKISELADRVSTLGGKQRGMPIDAGDWNAVVDVLRGLLEIDRAQEDNSQSSLESRFALRDHDHLGQVTVAWLDPSLQMSLGAGGDGVATRSAIADIQQQVAALNTQVAQLSTRLDQHQKALDQYAVNDVDRAKALSGFDARFAGVENLRTVVTGLGSQIDGISSNVKQVLELRKSLSDATGAPIDVSKIRQDVSALQTLSANFNGVDGQPVRMVDVQLKLKEISDASGVGGPGGLDGRLGVISTDLENKLAQRISDATETTKQQLIASQTDASAKAQAGLNAALVDAAGKLDQSAAARQVDAEARLSQGLTAQIATAVSGAKSDITASTSTLVDQKLSALPAQIDTAVTTAAARLKSTLQDALTIQVNSTTQTQVTAAEARLNQTLATQAANARTFQDQFATKTQADIADSVSRLSSGLSGNLNTQLGAARTAISSEIDAKVKTSSDAGSVATDQKIAAASQAANTNAVALVKAEVTTQMQNVPVQVNAAVDLRLAQADFAGQIQRSAAALTTSLESEISKAASDQQVRTTTAINGALTQLRGEMATAQTSAIDSAVQQSAALVNSLRTETATNIGAAVTKISTTYDAQIKDISTRLPARTVVITNVPRVG